MHIIQYFPYCVLVCSTAPFDTMSSLLIKVYRLVLITVDREQLFF